MQSYGWTNLGILASQILCAHMPCFFRPSCLYHHSHFFATPFDFTTFFPLAILNRATTFFQPGCFWVACRVISLYLHCILGDLTLVEPCGLIIAELSSWWLFYYRNNGEGVTVLLLEYLNCAYYILYMTKVSQCENFRGFHRFLVNRESFPVKLLHRWNWKLTPWNIIPQ